MLDKFYLTFRGAFFYAKNGGRKWQRNQDMQAIIGQC